MAEVQHRVDQLKKEQKKRDALAAKIKVIELSMPTYTDTLILSYTHTPILLYFYTSIHPYSHHPYTHTPILPSSIHPYSHTQAMESKLLAGGKNIVDHTDEQRRKLELQRQQVAKQKVKGSCDPITQSCDSAMCCGAAAGAGDSTAAGGQGGGLSGDPRDVLLPQRGGGDQDQEAPQGAVSLRIRSLKCYTLSLHLSLSLSLSLQLVSKLQAAQAEIAEYEEEQRRGREELAIAAEEMQKELSLR